MKNYVYRFKDKNENIIYIGKTTDINYRIKFHNHLDNKCYEEVKTIEYIAFKTSDDMDIAERYLIAKFKPKYNTIYKYNYITIDIDSIDNMKWTELKEHRFIEEEEKLTLYNFEEEVVTKSYKLYEPIQKEFTEYCSSSKYKVQDLISQALKEFLEKYR